MELRGRTHPEDVLPLLQALQDKNPRVRKTLVHVAGQISYKKDCLPKVLAHLQQWHNTETVASICTEIITVHRNYARFSAKSVAEAQKMVDRFLASR